jgi:flagellar motor switch protein FliN/FliY
MPPAAEIHHLADVPVLLDVELDRTTMTVREILAIDAGSVLKMTRSAGENIDILIDGTLVGSGEIVIMEDVMGIRVTDFRGQE